MSTANLAAALAKVQAELPKLERDRTVTVETKKGDDYTYSYVTLANLSETILPLLAKHGLSFAALPGAGSDGKMCVRYHLLHESGESLAGEFPISGEGGIQMIGGRITYARRYCLAAIVGVAADEDDEARLADDGQRTAQRKQAAPAQAARPPAQRTRSAAPALPGEGPEMISEAQMRRMQQLFTQQGFADPQRKRDYASQQIGRTVESVKELTKAEAVRVINALDVPTEEPGVEA